MIQEMNAQTHEGTETQCKRAQSDEWMRDGGLIANQKGREYGRPMKMV